MEILKYGNIEIWKYGASPIIHYKLYIINYIRMEILLRRIAKKKTYTIGRLYIVTHEEGKVKQEYFCDTLEPTWRNLLGVKLKPEEVDARYSRQSGKVARKVPGKTAIPEGRYPVVITKSPRFGKWLPLLLGVPGFEGIRIHSGNTADDTQGCILVGYNQIPGMVLNSRSTLQRLIARITEAREKEEAIWMEILKD